MLTTEQERLVDLREGSYLVLAPPGAGKTEVIAQRIVRLLAATTGEDYRVLALTYNNRAAASMRKRVKARLGDVSWRATIETYHAFYLDVLRHYGERVGVPPEVTLYDTEDSRMQALAQGLEEEGFLAERQDFDQTTATTLLANISQLKRSLTPSEAVSVDRASDGIPLKEAYRSYERVLARNGALDFDSILTKAYELLAQHPQVARHYRRMYRYILVDEAQDTSTIQFELLRALCGSEHRNVFMVADPDQLINRWLGADKRNLDRFKTDFGAMEMRLTTNFRCADLVVTHANRLLRTPGAAGPEIAPSGSSTGYVDAKSFDDEKAEAAAVVSWVTALLDRGLPSEWLAPNEVTELDAADVAVLARSRFQLQVLIKELERRSLPYVVRTGDSGPFDTAMYRCVLDAIRVLANPRDVAMRRTLAARVLASERSAGELDLASGDGPASSFLEALGTRVEGHVGDALTALARAENLAAAMDVFRVASLDDDQAPVSEMAELLRTDRELLVERWDRYRHGREESSYTWGGVVMALVDEPRSENAGIRVSTVHAAKGLEFRVVAVVGFNQGSFPDFRNTATSEDLDGERRLAYVAMTRAARALLVTRPRHRRTRYGNDRLQEPSIFLAETGLAVQDL